MSCIYQQGKKKDLDYVKNMASIYSKINKTDVQIYNDTLPVIGKIYNFDEAKEGRQGVVETIKFREPESENVLRDIEQPELAVVEPVKVKSKRRKTD